MQDILKSIHDWAAKQWWRSVLLVGLCGMLGGVADHYLGAGNFLTTALSSITTAVQ